jgi:aminoglycoside phosphotransferase (APT) family kinase protein
MAGTGPNNRASAVRPGEELDWQALDEALKRSIPGLCGEPEISQFPGGNSNLTYRLQYTDDDLVVRRPPFGTKASSAHSMIREYRIMSGLKPVYPAVPETLYYSDDESIIGSEFYVMRKVEGAVIRKVLPAEWQLGEEETRRLCTRFWEKLMELHQVNVIEAGLEDFGRAEGYVQRQVKGWNGRYERVVTPDVDHFADVQNWLFNHMPNDSGRQSILHGDYRIDNVILDHQPPHDILAVLDWEISALGDPLMDLGSALAYWMQPDDPVALRGLSMQPSMVPGMLTRREILALYTDRTGIDTREFSFYRVFGYWRIAVILQQIYYRYFHGQTTDQRFRGFGRAVQSLGRYCQELITG